jgi:DsbC/DsbD-like thiol-disulfide interchange protein
MFSARRFAWPSFAIIEVALALAAAPCVAAETASAWNGDSRSAMRLIAGSTHGAVLRAGVEIKLAPGWKTYWRYPGDSGVPPQFDFSASENVKSADVAWPAPLRFTDAEGSTIGYKDNVILPLRIVPTDASRPVVLKLKLDYAICERLCIPVDAKAELTLPGASPEGDAALIASEKRVPRKIELGAKAPLAIASVKRDGGRIIAEVAAPADTAISLFAEGPTADWALPLPEPAEGAPAGLKRFTFALEGLPPGAKPEGATLTLTAVAGDAAIETTFRLD